MDTSLLNEWHTGLVGGGSPHGGELLRGTGSLAYRGTLVPHQTCVTTHTRFHIVTIAFPPRCAHAGCSTNREGRIEVRQSLHVISNCEYRTVSNGHWYCKLNLSRDTICIKSRRYEIVSNSLYKTGHFLLL